jgi:hypothetical protein
MRNFNFYLTVDPKTPKEVRAALQKTLKALEIPNEIGKKEKVVDTVDERVCGGFLTWLLLTLAGAFINKLFKDLLDRSKSYKMLVDFIDGALKDVKLKLTEMNEQLKDKIENFKNFSLVFEIENRKPFSFALQESRELIASQAKEIFDIMR